MGEKSEKNGKIFLSTSNTLEGFVSLFSDQYVRNDGKIGLHIAGPGQLLSASF
jgi:hypothetical protein